VTGTADVIDASVALAATPGDTILTGDPGDPGDLAALLSATGTGGVRIESFG